MVLVIGATLGNFCGASARHGCYSGQFYGVSASYRCHSEQLLWC